MSPQLNAQLNVLAQKVEPFASRSNAVAEAIASIYDTVALMAKEGEPIVAEPELLSMATETEVAPEMTSETEAKKSRKAS